MFDNNYTDCGVNCQQHQGSVGNSAVYEWITRSLSVRLYGVKGQPSYWLWQRWNAVYFTFITWLKPVTCKGAEDTRVHKWILDDKLWHMPRTEAPKFKPWLRVELGLQQWCRLWKWTCWTFHHTSHPKRTMPMSSATKRQIYQPLGLRHSSMHSNRSNDTSVFGLTYRGRNSSDGSVLGSLSFMIQHHGFDPLLSFQYREFFPWS